MDEIYSLEHSQFSEDKGCFPFHVGPINDAIARNMQDCIHNNRDENKWQIVFIGSLEGCRDAMKSIQKAKRLK